METHQNQNEAADGRSDLTAVLGAERKLRYLLFMGHRHDGNPLCLYGDDGEMQCGVCHCDFVRDTPDELQRKIEHWNMQECIRKGVIKVTPNAK